MSTETNPANYHQTHHHIVVQGSLTNFDNTKIYNLTSSDLQKFPYTSEIIHFEFKQGPLDKFGKSQTWISVKSLYHKNSIL